MFGRNRSKTNPILLVFILVVIVTIIVLGIIFGIFKKSQNTPTQSSYSTTTTYITTNTPTKEDIFSTNNKLLSGTIGNNLTISLTNTKLKTKSENHELNKVYLYDHVERNGAFHSLGTQEQTVLQSLKRLNNVLNTQHNNNIETSDMFKTGKISHSDALLYFSIHNFKYIDAFVTEINFLNNNVKQSELIKEQKFPNVEEGFKEPYGLFMYKIILKEMFFKRILEHFLYDEYMYELHHLLYQEELKTFEAYEAEMVGTHSLWFKAKVFSEAITFAFLKKISTSLDEKKENGEVLKYMTVDEPQLLRCFVLMPVFVVINLLCKIDGEGTLVQCQPLENLPKGNIIKEGENEKFNIERKQAYKLVKQFSDLVFKDSFERNLDELLKLANKLKDVFHEIDGLIKSVTEIQ